MRFGQSREEGVNTITRTNIVLSIKHVEHLGGVLYCGHRDARLLKIRTQARLGLKGVCAFQTTNLSSILRSGLCSLLSVLGCLLIVP